MRKATIVSVTGDWQLEFPPEIQEQLNPGDEYLISVTDEAIRLSPRDQRRYLPSSPCPPAPHSPLGREPNFRHAKYRSLRRSI